MSNNNSSEVISITTNSNSTGEPNKLWNHDGWWSTGGVYNREPESSPLEKLMKDILLKEELKILVKEAIKEVMKELEEERLNEQLKTEFEIQIKRTKNGKKV